MLLFYQRTGVTKIQILHLSITTDNNVGAERRVLHTSDWDSVNLPPTYIFARDIEDLAEKSILGNQRLFVTQSSCTQTHQFAWKQFLNTSSSWLLVTEDDACVSDTIFFESFRSFPLKIPRGKDATIVQLGHMVFPKITLKKLLVFILNLSKIKGPKKTSRIFTNNFSYGTHCYLINREMASLLLEMDRAGHLGLDAHLMGFLNHELGQKCCNVYRKVIPVSTQWRADSNQDATQEYFGRKRKKLSFAEYVASIANSSPPYCDFFDLNSQ
jgi:GR25 family glycosyltransferase involved in LPS biosynthesis